MVNPIIQNLSGANNLMLNVIRRKLLDKRVLLSKIYGHKLPDHYNLKGSSKLSPEEQAALDFYECLEKIKLIKNTNINNIFNDVLSDISQPFKFFYNFEALEAPVILLETIRGANNNNEFLFYKPINGLSLTIKEYILQWTLFNNLHYVSVSNSIGARARVLIARAINYCRNSYGVGVAVQLVQDLWRFHWIFGQYTCTLFLEQAWGAGNEDNYTQLRSDEAFIFERFDEVDNALRWLKDNCQSFDEWIWGLYQLGPSVKLVYRLAWKSENDEVKKLWHIVDEMQVQIEELRFWLLPGSPNELSLTDRFIKNLNPELSFQNIELSGLQDRLEYELFYLNHIPKYWFDKALSLIENKNYNDLEELNRFDTELLFSVFCVVQGLIGYQY